MGTDMTEGVTRNRDTASNPKALFSLGPPPVPTIPWLDPATAAGVVDIVQSLAADHPEAYAVILFGSVARHEERPLDDPEPSDVDLLLLIDPAVFAPSAAELTRAQELALIHTIGEADYRQQSPREIKFIFATRNLQACDELFIENLARDGILLWARGLLPEPLAALAERGPIAPLAVTAK